MWSPVKNASPGLALVISRDLYGIPQDSLPPECHVARGDLLIREGSCPEFYGMRRVLPFPQNLTCWSYEVASRTELRRKTVQIERVFRDWSMFNVRRKAAAGGRRSGSENFVHLVKRGYAWRSPQGRKWSEVLHQFSCEVPDTFFGGDVFVRVVMAVRNLRAK